MLRNDIQAARVDMAAALRQAVWIAYQQAISNLCLVNPLGLSWSEFKASKLLTCDRDRHISLTRLRQGRRINLPCVGVMTLQQLA